MQTHVVNLPSDRLSDTDNADDTDYKKKKICVICV